MNIWQGTKIKLRSFEPDDGDLFFEMISDTEIQRLVSDIRFPMSRKTAFDVAADLSEGKNTEEYFFIIEDMSHNKVGTIDVHDFDKRVGSFSCGICIKTEYQKQGYAAESMYLVLRYFFEELRCQKVTVQISSFNANSIRLAERFGFAKEGCIRRTIFTKGRHYDELIYGMTVEEFFEKYAQGFVIACK